MDSLKFKSLSAALPNAKESARVLAQMRTAASHLSTLLVQVQGGITHLESSLKKMARHHGIKSFPQEILSHIFELAHANQLSDSLTPSIYLGDMPIEIKLSLWTMYVADTSVPSGRL